MMSPSIWQLQQKHHRRHCQHSNGLSSWMLTAEHKLNSTEEWTHIRQTPWTEFSATNSSFLSYLPFPSPPSRRWEKHICRVMFHSACHILRGTWTNYCVLATRRKGSCLMSLSISYSTPNSTLYLVIAWAMLAEWMSEWMIIKLWHSRHEYRSWFWRRRSDVVKLFLKYSALLQRIEPWRMDESYEKIKLGMP